MGTQTQVMFLLVFALLLLTSAASALQCCTGMSTDGTTWATGGSSQTTCASGIPGCYQQKTVSGATTSYIIGCAQATQPTTSAYTTGCTTSAGGSTVSLKVFTSDQACITAAAAKSS